VIKINTISIIGRLVSDPTIKYTQAAKAVGNISIAVNNRFNKDEAYFFDCTAWGRVAELAGEYLRKGSKVGIVGSLQQQRWEKEGKKYSKVIINVEQLEFLDSKKQEEQSGFQGEDVTEDTDIFPFD